MNLPEKLVPVRRELIAALGLPILAAWPEESSFALAPQAEAIGRVLIPVLHDHLNTPHPAARIAYLFRKEIKNKAGVASKAGGKLQFLSDYDFTIEINWTAWRLMTAEQRIALVDHELLHCAYDFEKEKWAMREHDVEEFREIIDRWGLWHPALRTFGQSVTTAQTSLFEQHDAAAS